MGKGYKPGKTPPISIENETQMWEKIRLMMTNAISKYTTSL